MREQQCQAKNAIESLAFAAWLRSGAVPDDVTELARAMETGKIEFKFNPYHDPANGRFAFAPGRSPSTRSYRGMTKHGVGSVQPVSGGYVDQNGRYVPEQFAPDPYALHTPAEALAHYAGGSGEDRNYYFSKVDMSRVKPTDFLNIADLIANAKPGLYPIVDAGSAYNGDYSGPKSISSWATVEVLTFRRTACWRSEKMAPTVSMGSFQPKMIHMISTTEGADRPRRRS